MRFVLQRVGVSAFEVPNSPRGVLTTVTMAISIQ
jgi:hypothetical protein